jgi:hypothetical protein
MTTTSTSNTTIRAAHKATVKTIVISIRMVCLNSPAKAGCLQNIRVPRQEKIVSKQEKKPSKRRDA